MSVAPSPSTPGHNPAMVGVLLIAHAPLASALKAVATHAFPDREDQVFALDLAPDAQAEDVIASARVLMAASWPTNWLVLTDAFGATPCNAALALRDAERQVRLISGLNVPMLWRALCYGDEPLDAMVDLAAEGGHVGIKIADLPILAIP